MATVVVRLEVSRWGAWDILVVTSPRTPDAGCYNPRAGLVVPRQVPPMSPRLRPTTRGTLGQVCRSGVLTPSSLDAARHLQVRDVSASPAPVLSLETFRRRRGPHSPNALGLDIGTSGRLGALLPEFPREVNRSRCLGRSRIALNGWPRTNTGTHLPVQVSPMRALSSMSRSSPSRCERTVKTSETSSYTHARYP